MIRPFGEHALLVELDGWQAARALGASLRDEPVAGVEAAVPALASVLVELEQAAADRADEIATAIARRVEAGPQAPRAGRVRTVPVVYDGPDLRAAAQALGLAPEELAERHAAAEVRALFCGFAPGFAYLGELPEAIRLPRLATPRTHTPAGSVAMAGAMTGIYPAELPGGWRVIGRTPLALFDPRRDPPSYLTPGDTVRWRRIEAGDWPAGGLAAADDW